VEWDVPKKFASYEYLKNLKRMSSNNACIIYNKMTELDIHKKELVGVSAAFEKVFPNAIIHKLIVNDSENSILYSNTLPLLIEEAIYA
jgi:hypothetical protein